MHAQPNKVTMSRVIILILLTAGLLLSLGCAVDRIDGPGLGGPRPVEFTGEVVYVPLEGGFYGIIDRSGRKLNPMNLDESLKKDGIAIEGVYRARPDVAGIRQWGTIVELIHQQRVYRY